MLRDLLRRDFEPGLRRMATVLREEDQYLRTLTAMAMTSIVDDEKSLRLSPLRALPLALQRRVIRRWLREANISSPGFREVETVRALYRDPSSAAKANLPGGWHVRRRAGKIFLEPPPG
jgi:tRNA(Ile)-lysidine synthase